MRRLLLYVYLFGPAVVFGQPETTLTSIKSTPTTTVYGYTGTNLIYACTARSRITGDFRGQLKTAISAVSNANPAVMTSTAHGFPISSRPSVTITGFTAGWATGNGAVVATVIDANTFSIPVDSTAFGALAGSPVYTSTGPRTNVAEWQVQIYTYDGSNNLIWSGWLNGITAMTQKCSDATNTAKSIQ